jgi:hypothetical protein
VTWQASRVRRFLPMVAISLALPAVIPAAPAAGQGVTAQAVATALQRDPVYVAPSVRRQLPPAAARRLRRRIRRVDRGRIQVAVVPPGSADQAGGIRSFGNAIDQALPERRGTLLATTGQDFQAVTSHSAVDPTVTALRHAVESHKDDPLSAQLLAAVDGIGAVDPGASRDINGPPQGGGANAGGGGDGGDGGGSDAGAIVAVVLAALVLIPLLVLGLWALLRWRSRRQASSEVAELDLGSARDELLALGQDIEDLDLDTQMPNASPQGRDEYNRALMLYERANRALADKDPSEVQIYEAKRAAEEGRARIEAARKALTATQ